MLCWMADRVHHDDIIIMMIMIMIMMTCSYSTTTVIYTESTNVQKQSLAGERAWVYFQTTIIMINDLIMHTTYIYSMLFKNVKNIIYYILPGEYSNNTLHMMVCDADIVFLITISKKISFDC